MMYMLDMLYMLYMMYMHDVHAVHVGHAVHAVHDVHAGHAVHAVHVGHAVHAGHVGHAVHAVHAVLVYIQLYRCTFLYSRNCFRNSHIAVPHLIGGNDGDIVLVQRVYCYQSGRGGRDDVWLYAATVYAQRKSTHIDSVLCDRENCCLLEPAR